ncbi:MAG: hypothetical protein QOC77_2892 [Thermoleophilaceae bacterium]|nr:hypothetical protein [Thermoleophilaceae bacterium]
MRKTLVAGALALAATVAPAAAASAKDTNHDRIPDRWERAYHLSLKVDQSKRDQDHDGLKNRAEWLDHTSPRAADTDRDGLPDAHDAQPTEPSDSSQPPESPESPQPPDGAAQGPGHVVSYQQSSGFGGVLTLERANGERVTAYFGEKTDLRCAAAAADEPAVCTKEKLVAGTPVAAAEHGPNDRGYDVWTKIVLVTADGSVTPPPPVTTPPPAPGPAVGGTVLSYEQSPYLGGTLTIQRANGETVAAWFGDGTDLRCAPAADAEYAPCTKAQLTAGALASDARHAVNAGGHDVWTRLRLVVPGFTG